MLSGWDGTEDCLHHPSLICPILLIPFILIIKIIRGIQMARSISQAILDVLAEAGAQDVFGVVGDVINPFVLETINDPRFNWITVDMRSMRVTLLPRSQSFPARSVSAPAPPAPVPCT